MTDDLIARARRRVADRRCHICRGPQRVDGHCAACDSEWPEDIIVELVDALDAARSDICQVTDIIATRGHVHAEHAEGPGIVWRVKYLCTLLERHRARRFELADAADAVDAARGRVYPCDKCGVLRTESEGGRIFTVCDECWRDR